MSFAGAAPISGHTSWLVYFRANPVNGFFPATPWDLMSLESPGCLVIANLTDRKIEEHIIADPVTLDLAVAALFEPKFALGKVYTIHGNSVLGRLTRWFSIKHNVSIPQALQPRYAGDLVELANAPAVLSGVWRYNFKVSEYVDVLGLTPVPGFDEETGLIADMALRYGN